MASGFAFALSEISLVLFTTLAPSGAVAFALMGASLHRGTLDADVRESISKLLCIPLIVTMVGLVESATHLGNPDNALYVIAGIGRSPLSTEVASAVVFLALAGVFWLLTFSRRFPLAAQRIWLGVAQLAAVVFVATVAFAYWQETIATWHLWEVSAALCLNSLVGGPLLALFGLRAAKAPVSRASAKGLLVVEGVALAANIAVYALQCIDLAAMRNAMASVSDLAPGFPVFVAAFAVLCAAGCALSARAGEKPADGAGSVGSGTCRLLVMSGGGCLLAFAGIFLMRFAFYATHLTVGL